MAENESDDRRQGRPPATTKDQVYEAVRDRDTLVLSSTEVGEAVDASRRTALDRLRDLEDDGKLASREVAGASVWYLPGERPVRPDDVDDVLGELEAAGAIDRREVDGTPIWLLPGNDPLPSSGAAAEDGPVVVEDDPDIATAGGVAVEGEAGDLLREIVTRVEGLEQRISASQAEKTTQADVVEYARQLSRNERKRLAEEVSPRTPSKREVARESPGLVFASLVLGGAGALASFFGVGLSFILFLEFLNTTYSTGAIAEVLFVVMALFVCGGALLFAAYKLYQRARETALSKLEADDTAEKAAS